MKIAAFVIYFVAMLGIGLFFFIKSKNQSGEKDYFLGGRSMGPWVTAMSAQASDMSGWLLMGFPGSILAFGMGKVWIGIGLALGTALNWIIVAKRLRRFSKASDDSITLPQYLTNRFASSSPVLKVVCAIIFLIAFTVYVASAFNAGTTVFCAVIPWFADHRQLAMIIFALIILVYTFMGGYKAVCWTDFFQGILMLVALLAVPIIMLSLGNFDGQYANAFADGVTAFNSNPFTASWQDITSGLAWGLGYFGMPHILVRFMAIEKPSMVKKSATVAIIWVVLSLAATIVIAYLGRMFIYTNGTDLSEVLLREGKQSLIFVELARDVFPAFISGLLLAAIIAASMSTADSQLLVAASSFASDLYKPIVRKNASNKEMLWVSRAIVIVISVVAFFIASSKGKAAQAIMDLVSNAWGIFGAAFGPAVLLSLFWKRFTYKGAVAGIIVGALVDMLWLWLPVADGASLTAITGIYEIIPGFVIGAIAAVVVTLIDKAPSKEVEEVFAKATDNSIDD